MWPSSSSPNAEDPVGMRPALGERVVRRGEMGLKNHSAAVDYPRAVSRISPQTNLDTTTTFLSRTTCTALLALSCGI